MELTFDKLLDIVSTLPDPLFIITESGHYAGIFGGGDRNYYHDGSGLVGASLYDVLPQDKAEWFIQQVSRTLQTNQLQIVEYGLAGSDVEGLDADKGPEGEIHFEGRIQTLPFLIDGERAVIWTAQNITQRYQLENQLRRMSEIDDMTGAYNRRKLLDELELRFREFLRYDTPTSLLMIDIDHFKAINDSHGHLTGDEVLRNMVSLCMSLLREPDLFSRFGGEEFVVLLPHTDLPQASETAERLRSAIARNVTRHNGREITITISVGVSCLKETDVNFESVIKRVDDALYVAKRAGRNCVRVLPAEPLSDKSTQ